MELNHITKSYGTHRVLEDVSYAFGDGITCIMGPSGRGKTTLLRLILGLEKPDSGNVSGLPARFSAVFQEDRLLEHQTALGNLRFILGSMYEEGKTRALLNALGMEEWEDKPVRAFSGGMKRRLALARALLAPSDCLVLDEPFAGLDEESKARAIAQIKAAGRQALIVTHDKADAEALGAEIFML